MFINQMVPKRVLFLVPNKIDDSDAAFFYEIQLRSQMIHVPL